MTEQKNEIKRNGHSLDSPYHILVPGSFKGKSENAVKELEDTGIVFDRQNLYDRMSRTSENQPYQPVQGVSRGSLNRVLQKSLRDDAPVIERNSTTDSKPGEYRPSQLTESEAFNIELQHSLRDVGDLGRPDKIAQVIENLKKAKAEIEEDKQRHVNQIGGAERNIRTYINEYSATKNFTNYSLGQVSEGVKRFYEPLHFAGKLADSAFGWKIFQAPPTSLFDENKRRIDESQKEIEYRKSILAQSDKALMKIDLSLIRIAEYNKQLAEQNDPSQIVNITNKIRTEISEVGELLKDGLKIDNPKLKEEWDKMRKSVSQGLANLDSQLELGEHFLQGTEKVVIIAGAIAAAGVTGGTSLGFVGGILYGTGVGMFGSAIQGGGHLIGKHLLGEEINSEKLTAELKEFGLDSKDAFFYSMGNGLSNIVLGKISGAVASTGEKIVAPGIVRNLLQGSFQKGMNYAKTVATGGVRGLITESPAAFVDTTYALYYDPKSLDPYGSMADVGLSKQKIFIKNKYAGEDVDENSISSMSTALVNGQAGVNPLWLRALSIRLGCAMTGGALSHGFQPMRTNIKRFALYGPEAGKKAAAELEKSVAKEFSTKLAPISGEVVSKSTNNTPAGKNIAHRFLARGASELVTVPELGLDAYSGAYTEAIIRGWYGDKNDKVSPELLQQAFVSSMAGHVSGRMQNGALDRFNAIKKVHAQAGASNFQRQANEVGNSIGLEAPEVVTTVGAKGTQVLKKDNSQGDNRVSSEHKNSKLGYHLGANPDGVVDKVTKLQHRVQGETGLDIDKKTGGRLDGLVKEYVEQTSEILRRSENGVGSGINRKAGLANDRERAFKTLETEMATRAAGLALLGEVPNTKFRNELSRYDDQVKLIVDKTFNDSIKDVSDRPTKVFKEYHREAKIISDDLAVLKNNAKLSREDNSTLHKISKDLSEIKDAKNNNELIELQNSIRENYDKLKKSIEEKAITETADYEKRLKQHVERFNEELRLSDPKNNRLNRREEILNPFGNRKAELILHDQPNKSVLVDGIYNTLGVLPVVKQIRDFTIDVSRKVGESRIANGVSSKARDLKNWVNNLLVVRGTKTFVSDLVHATTGVGVGLISLPTPAYHGSWGIYAGGLYVAAAGTFNAARSIGNLGRYAYLRAYRGAGLDSFVYNRGSGEGAARMLARMEEGKHLKRLLESSDSEKNKALIQRLDAEIRHAEKLYEKAVRRHGGLFGVIYRNAPTYKVVQNDNHARFTDVNKKKAENKHRIFDERSQDMLQKTLQNLFLMSQKIGIREYSAEVGRSFDKTLKEKTVNIDELNGKVNTYLSEFSPLSKSEKQKIKQDLITKLSERLDKIKNIAEKEKVESYIKILEGEAAPSSSSLRNINFIEVSNLHIDSLLKPESKSSYEDFEQQVFRHLLVVEKSNLSKKEKSDLRLESAKKLYEKVKEQAKTKKDNGANEDEVKKLFEKLNASLKDSLNKIQVKTWDISVDKKEKGFAIKGKLDKASIEKEIKNKDISDNYSKTLKHTVYEALNPKLAKYLDENIDNINMKQVNRIIAESIKDSNLILDAKSVKDIIESVIFEVKCQERLVAIKNNPENLIEIDNLRSKLHSEDRGRNFGKALEGLLEVATFENGREFDKSKYKSKYLAERYVVDLQKSKVDQELKDLVKNWKDLSEEAKTEVVRLAERKARSYGTKEADNFIKDLKVKHMVDRALAGKVSINTTSANFKDLRSLVKEFGDIRNKSDNESSDKLAYAKEGLTSALYKMHKFNEMISKMDGNMKPEDIAGSEFRLVSENYSKMFGWSPFRKTINGRVNEAQKAIEELQKKKGSKKELKKFEEEIKIKNNEIILLRELFSQVLGGFDGKGSF